MKANAFKKTMATLLAAIMLLSFAPAHVFAAMGLQYDEANERYYLNMPTTGDETLDLTDKDAGFDCWIFDDGGEDGNYSSNCNSTLTVTVKEGCILQLKADINTESGYDYFYVYNGNSADEAKQLGKYSGSPNTSPIYSTGNALTLKFTSDGGLERSGIDVQISVVDPASLLRVSFLPGDGSGTMDDIVAAAGDRVYLPECGFELPEKTFFDYYTDGVNTYHARDYITVEDNITLTAVYINKVILTYKSGDDTETAEVREGGTVTLGTYSRMFVPPYRCAFLKWQCDGVDYAEGAWYKATEDVTFTAVFEQLPILFEDGNGGYCAVMPITGEYEVDLKDKPNGFSFAIYDDGGADGDYADNCDGSLVITAPEGYVVRVSGKFDTEYYEYDYVVVYDTDMTTKLGNGAYGEGQYGGYTTMPELVSTGNKMKISFISNTSYSSSGFELKAVILDPSTLATVTFNKGEGSGEMNPISWINGEELTIPACTFYGPYDQNYDRMVFAYYTDGTHNYIPGDVITLEGDVELTAVYGERCVVTYQYYDDEYQYENTQTVAAAKGAAIRLAAFDSLFSSMPKKKYFVGWESGGEVYAAGAVVTITGDTTFEADLQPVPVLIEDGEGGWYALSPINDTDTVDLSDKPVGFSFKVYDDGKDENYSTRNYSSYLIIKAPAGSVLKISDGSGRLEYFDRLLIYDGPDDSSDELYRVRYKSSKFTIPTLVSSGNEIMISFYSDSSGVDEGFELTVTVVEAVYFTYVYGEETKSVAFEKGSTATLAKFEDLFELPYEKEFLCWRNGGDEYAEGAELAANAGMTFTAVLGTKPTVTFDGNGALLNDDSGNTVTLPLPVNTGEEITLPHAREYFYRSGSKVFGGWSLEGVTYGVGDTYTVTGDVVFTAIWVEPSAWDVTADTLNAEPGTDLGTVALTEDLIGGTGSDLLNVPQGVTVTLDLAGHTIDGSATAAGAEGTMAVVRGDLTVVDSVGGGSIVGGGIAVLDGANFIAPDAILAGFKASVENSYYLRIGNNDENHDGVYSVVFYPTLYDAFYWAAVIEPDYQDEIAGIPDDGNYMFGYNDAYVKMLADTTIAQDEVWEIVSHRSIWFDLNGCTFDIQGKFTGGYPVVNVINGVETPEIYPTDIHVVSEVLGVFRISGIVEVMVQPWTADTYYITGGELNRFFCDGGTYYVTGGKLANGYFNNGNQNAALNINLSGDALLDNVSFVVYSEEQMQPMNVTVSDSVRMKDVEVRIGGDGDGNYTGNKPFMTVNGGYFDVDPGSWMRGLVEVPFAELDQDNLSQYYVARWRGDRTPYDELEDYYRLNLSQYQIYVYSDTCFEEFFAFASEPEEYSGQTDWAADSGVYTWRIASEPAVLRGDFDGDGEITVADALAALRIAAKLVPETPESVAIGDADGDGHITVSDALRILRVAAKLADSL